MRTCWGITDGSTGMAAQVRALALAMGVQPVMKKIIVKKPWCWLPNFLYARLLQPCVIPDFIEYGSDPMMMPWPDLVISCGRRSAIVSLGLQFYMRSASTSFIHIQDPHINPKHFDAVVAMEHDKIKGLNVVKSRFALHAITKPALEEASERFAGRFSFYPKPRIAVLFGGSTNKYQLTEEAMVQAMVVLQQALKNTEGSLLITPSRRTGNENIATLKQAFAGNGRVYIYDFVGENPYMGMLAVADAIFVTNDSVNMMTEAAATGKPLYLLPLAGHQDTKPARFADMLLKMGIARVFNGRMEQWDYQIDNEMQRVAKDVEKLLR